MALKLICFLFCLLTAAIASCSYPSTLQDYSLALKTTPDLPDTLCPTWFTPALINDSVWCECNTDRVQQGLVLRCPSKNKICVQNCTHQEHYSTNSLNVSILTGFCITHNFETRQTLLALCPYNTHQANLSDFFITLPSNISELNNFMCGPVQRKGDLCYQCRYDHIRGPTIRDDGIECRLTRKSAAKWLIIVLGEIIPPTCLFLIVLFVESVLQLDL